MAICSSAISLEKREESKIALLGGIVDLPWGIRRSAFCFGFLLDFWQPKGSDGMEIGEMQETPGISYSGGKLRVSGRGG